MVASRGDGGVRRLPTAECARAAVETGKPRDHNESVNLNKFFPAGRYLKAFKHFASWIDNGVDLYKVSAIPQSNFRWKSPYMEIVRVGENSLAVIHILIP